MFDNFNINLVIYIIVAILVVAYGSFQISKLFGTLEVIVYFGGSLYICILYGIRWFGAGASTTPISWPPVINTCPDYLTYFKRTVNGASVDTCIDTIGITDQTILKKFPSDGTTPSEPEYYFSLATTSNDKQTELCNRAMAAKLTWEGITNGESCIGKNGQAGGTSGTSTTCLPVG